MIKNNHTAKTSHNENFDFLIEELVQNKVSELLSVFIERFQLAQSMQESNEVLTVTEVAELLGLSERVVREKINYGFIPAYKPDFSNKFFILKSELVNEIMRGTRYRSISNFNHHE